MKTTRLAGFGRLGRGAQALAAVALAAAALAGSGPAAAAAHPGSVGAARGAPGAGVISTVAGGAGGPARATQVILRSQITASTVCGVAFGSGHLYIADGASVRQVDPSTDRLTTPAGTGTFGPFGEAGRANQANLVAACSVAVGGSGNLVIDDSGHNRIRLVASSTGTFFGKAMTAGHIYTVAGKPRGGFSGDGGPATSAKLGNSQGVAVDAAGNLLIADSGNSRVRVVAAHTGTFYAQPMTAGDIYTIAGNGTAGFSGDGGPATSAELRFPEGMAVDAAGNLLIADNENSRVRVVAARAGTFYGQPMTAGDIYTIAGNGTAGFSGDGGPATSAELQGPVGMAVDAAGNLLIADNGNQRIRVVAAHPGTFYGQPMTVGDIYTIAGNGNRGFSGDGGPATSARFDNPIGVAVGGGGNVLIADAGNFRVRAVAASTGTFYGRAMTAGHIYTIAGNGHNGFSGDRRPATRAQLNSAGGAAVDGAGNLLFADGFDQRILVVAASTAMFFGQPMNAGDIYSVAGTGVAGFSGDRGPAASARLRGPETVAADAAGNLLISDSGNERIRVVAAHTGTFYGQPMTAGDIYTIAGNGTAGFSGDGGPATSAELNLPRDVTVDAAGNLVISDGFNFRIRVVAASTGTFYGQAMTAGDIYTIAGNGTAGFSGDGGPATSAELNGPQGVIVDAAGNVLIADENNARIRVVAVNTGTFYGQPMTAGDIYTIAGNGTAGFSGDGGPATSARLANPAGVAVDAAANVLIADAGNNRVRAVAASTGTFYGRPMTAGHIYTIAGNGIAGFSGDGGAATRAALSAGSVTVDGAGDLLIAGDETGRVRMVTG